MSSALHTRLAALQVIFLLTALAPAPGAEAAGFDHAIFADILSDHVRNGVVDYRGLKGDEGRLDRYLDLLNRARVEDFDRNTAFAFYIDAYNACTLKLVLGGYPGIRSIKELGSFFSPFGKKPVCPVGGKVLTLDDIEHGVLRPRFRDPRVHFAINCASRGCPILASVPYRGETLDAQLDAAARGFINNPEKCRVEDGRLKLSMIFKWYAGDFQNGVPAFIGKYAEGDLKRALSDHGRDLPVDYLDYDWTLNGE